MSSAAVAVLAAQVESLEYTPRRTHSQRACVHTRLSFISLLLCTILCL